MKIKRNAGFLTMLPIMLGGYSLNAVAITNIQPAPSGKVYNFTADLNSSSTDLYLDSNGSYNNDYMGYTMDLSPYINQDVSSNFTAANPSISGQFTYNSSAPQISTFSSNTYSQTTYNVNNESFTLNLSSENSETGQVFLGDGPEGYGSKSMTTETGSYIASGNDYQAFQFGSYGGTNPNVTLSSSSNFGCGEFELCDGSVSYSIQDYHPQDDIMQGNLPDFFSDIESVSFDLYPSLGFDTPSSGNQTYQLNDANMYLGFSGHNNLPTDGTLPGTLPTLAESTYAYLGLDFYSSFLSMYGNEVSIGDIQFTADSPYYTDYTNVDYSAPECQQYPGCGPYSYYLDKETQLSDFLSNASLNSSASIDYTLTALTPLADGLTPDTPLLPDVNANPANTDPGLFDFTFDSNSTGFTFIDPYVANGYNYDILSGTNYFTDVLLPVGFGVGNQFDLWLDDGLGNLIDSGINLTGGIAYHFTDPLGLGINRFGIRGIDPSLLLDPNDPLAFTTGLQFINPGAPVNMSQTAVTVFVADTVPAPTTLILLMSGMIGFAVRQRKV